MPTTGKTLLCSCRTSAGGAVSLRVARFCELVRWNHGYNRGGKVVARVDDFLKLLQLAGGVRVTEMHDEIRSRLRDACDLRDSMAADDYVSFR